MHFTFCLHQNTFSVMWLYVLSPTFICAKQRNHKKNAVEEKSEWKWIESIKIAPAVCSPSHPFNIL
jgi:hypothetical protein